MEIKAGVERLTLKGKQQHASSERLFVPLRSLYYLPYLYVPYVPLRTLRRFSAIRSFSAVPMEKYHLVQAFSY